MGQQQDWFAANAPAKKAEQDWFAENATTKKPAQTSQTFGDMVGGPLGMAYDLQTGIVKGAGKTVVGLGRLVHQIPGVSRAVDALYGDAGDGEQTLSGLVTGEAPRKGLSAQAFEAADRVLAPANTAQAIGTGAEQIAEFMIPASAAEKAALKVGTNLAAKAPAMFQKAARFFPRVAAQGAVGAGQSAVQGTDPLTGGAIAAAVPVAGGVATTAANALSKTAVRMARTAIKPTVTTLKKMVGSSRNLDAKAEEIATFIVKNRLGTADQARKLFQAAENELQALLKNSKAPTDAATRAERYLGALERSAAKQGLPAEDVAAIRNAASDLVKGPMGEDVVRMVAQPHPTLLGANGKPITVMVPQTTRQLRAAVPADEALESARASGRWKTRKQWGEQKGTTIETQKAVERAQRDAVKTAVPEARPLLKTEGQSLTAADVLDRMAQRQGNREAISMPAQITAAIELSSGKVPVMAVAANWLRNNGLKAGIQANRLAEAMLRNDTKAVSAQLARLGVSLELQTR